MHLCLKLGFYNSMGLIAHHYSSLWDVYEYKSISWQHCQLVETKAHVICSSWTASCFRLCWHLNWATIVFVPSIHNYILSAPLCKCKCFSRVYKLKAQFAYCRWPEFWWWWWWQWRGGGREGVSFLFFCAQHMCTEEQSREATETVWTDNRWAPFRETWQ